MKYEQGNVRIHVGDCVESMREMADGSVNCCVTSPPYFGLRDYGTGKWQGGSDECDHIEKQQPQSLAALADKHAPRSSPRNKNRQDDEQINTVTYRSKCGKCGAVRVDDQIGLEETPGEYVDKMVVVFEEVRRVLADDGTLWLNLGDSYSTNLSGHGGFGEWTTGGSPKPAAGTVSDLKRTQSQMGVKPKNLLGMPWRVALALQAAGWYLRQDIIWHKPNPMPESVTDRCTKAHEYMFLLSKSARYHYDADAIREPADQNRVGENQGRWGNAIKESRAIAMGRKPSGGNEGNGTPVIGTETRNRRSVWTIPTRPFPDAHFAVFPPALVKPCILAGCPSGGVVFDPFTGSGTTALVAIENGCGFVGCELNPEYADMAWARLLPEIEQGRLFA